MIFEKKTNELGKHYLYGHLRLDTNEYFYIGIGTKYNHNKDYTRAKAGCNSKGLIKSKSRNSIWRGIVSRTDFKIEILYENDDYDFIKQKEIELITKYGQIMNNTGTLCNLTKGGDGLLGFRNENIIKPVHLYKKTGEFYKSFDSHIDCSKFLNVLRPTIGLSIDKDFLIKGYIIKSFKTDNVDPILDIKEKLKKRLSKPVYQFDLNGNFIKEWVSTSEAARVLGLSGGHIRDCAGNKKRANNGKNYRKTVGGFIFKYDINDINKNN
jgi:hypothetical protein